MASCREGAAQEREGEYVHKGGHETRCLGPWEGEKGAQDLVGLELVLGLKGSHPPLTSAPLALRLLILPPHTWVLTTACSLSGSRAVADTGLRLDSRACT